MQRYGEIRDEVGRAGGGTSTAPEATAALQPPAAPPRVRTAQFVIPPHESENEDTAQQQLQEQQQQFETKGQDMGADAGKKRAVVVVTLTRIIKSLVTGQAPVTLEMSNTLRKIHKQTKRGTRINHS